MKKLLVGVASLVVLLVLILVVLSVVGLVLSLQVRPPRPSVVRVEPERVIAHA